MNTGSNSINCFKMNVKGLIFALIFMLTSFNSLEAANVYFQVYSGIANGGLSWTGNTLGLSKIANQNNPGTQDSIGAFITTNTALKVNSYPAGTTLNYTLNNSLAVLDLPTGSTILHAELIWGGSYGFGSTLTSATALATSVTLRTPDSVIHTLAPSATTKQFVNYTTGAGSAGGYYVCSQDVTSILQALGTASGNYVAGGIPGTVVATQPSANCAGWTLAVAYSNPNMKTSNLALYVGCILTADSSSPIVNVTGFTAPITGTISARLFVSALEGDASLTGDSMQIGISSPPATKISGTNNPVNNFFCSQINTLLTLTTDVSSGKLVATGSSLLDTRGSFGTVNANSSTGTNVSGGRQGYDITSIDISANVSPGQQQLYVQGTTSADSYVISGLGMQLQTDSPIIKSTKTASVTSAGIGNTFTYTLTFQNTGGAAASNLKLIDVLPSGLSFVNGSFTLNGVSQPSVTYATLSTTGVAIGNPSPNLAIGATTTVTFQALVVSTSPTPQPSSYSNVATVNYSFSPFGTPITLSTQTNTFVVINTAPVSPPVANNDTGITNANTVLNQATSVLNNDTGTGTLSINSYSATTSHGGTISMIMTGVSAGTYTYTPPANFSGTGVNADTFVYNITDSTAQISNTATVTLTVTPLATPDTATVAANTMLTMNTSVLANDFGSGLFVSAYDAVSDQGGTVLVNANGTYTYTPPLNFSGSDTFSYTAQDSSGQTVTAEVTITVLPVAPPGSGVTPANQTYNGMTNPIGIGVTISSYQNPSAQGGTVSMTTSGPDVGAFVYTPPFNYSGLDTFTYTLSSSSTGTVTMTVLPVAFNDTSTTNANVPLVQPISVLNNDAGSGLSIIPLSLNLTSIQGGTIIMQTDGTYTYTPPPNFSGVDTFVYTAQDSPLGNLTQATVTITVDPTGTDDAVTTFANTAITNAPSVLANDSGSLQIVSYQNPSTQNGMVMMNTDGTYVYIPPMGFSGFDTFTYTASDPAGHTITQTVTVTVLPLVFPATGTTNLNTPLNSDVALGSDVGTGLSVIPTSGSSVQGGTFTINADGTYTYTPPLDFLGTDVFNFTVIDSSGNQVTSTVTIQVIFFIAPPTNFNGCVKTIEFFDKSKHILTATWTASTSVNVVSYHIYHNGHLVAVIPAGSPLIFKTCVKSKKSAAKYQITAVDSSGVESVPTDITLIKC